MGATESVGIQPTCALVGDERMAVGATSVGGPGKKRSQSTPLGMSREDRPNCCARMDCTASETAATATGRCSTL